MIIDVNAFIGHWPSVPLVGDVASVRASLQAVGVDLICLSPLEAAWRLNPHLANAAVYDAAHEFSDVSPVPVLDPTIATWPGELARAQAHPRLRLVRLLPTYSPYELTVADEMLEAVAKAGLGAIVQMRLEDRRRQHSLAQVPDLAADEVVELARRHPGLTVIAGGPRTADIMAMKESLLAVPNLYADLSQADGLNVVRGLVEDGLGGRLLFGSHAPFFIPYAALARVLTDLDDARAQPILGGNAQDLFGPA